jgi:hypothetical protein
MIQRWNTERVRSADRFAEIIYSSNHRSDEWRMFMLRPRNLKGMALLTILAVMLSLFPMTSLAASDPDLAAWWTFDEGSGTTVSDKSGNGRSLTVVGESKWTEGQSGKAFDFNGSTVLSMSGKQQISAYNLTAAMWVNLKDFPASDNGANMLFCNEAESALGQGAVDLAFLEKKLTSYVCGVKWDIGDRVMGATECEALLNGWHHIAVVYNQDYTEETGMAYLYIDGKEEAKSEIAVTIGGNYFLGFPKTAQFQRYDFTIGGYKQGTEIRRAILGVMDDLRIYTRALSQDEISKLAGAGSSTNEPSPSATTSTGSGTPDTTQATPEPITVSETPTAEPSSEPAASESSDPSTPTPDGTSDASVTTAEPKTETAADDPTSSEDASTTVETSVKEVSRQGSSTGTTTIIIGLAVILIIAGAAAFILMKKKKK